MSRVSPAGAGAPSPATPVNVIDVNGIAMGLYAVPGDAVVTDSASKQRSTIVVDSSLQIVYWGSAWKTARNPALGDVNDAVRKLLNGSYLSQMAQYGYRSVTFRGSIIVTSPNPRQNYSSNDAGDLIWNMIDQNLFPEPDNSGERNIYIVIMPPGTNLPTGIRGAHSEPSDYDLPFNVAYAWVGWAGNGSLGFIMDVLSHELFKSISDPEPSSGWVWNRNINGGNQMGDASNNTVDRTDDNLLLEAYWSQAQRPCVVPYGKSNDFDEDLLGSQGRLAAAHQTSDDQLDVLFVDKSGALNVSWVTGEGAWQGPAALTGANFAPQTASIALAHQNDMNQLNAAIVGNDGALSIIYVVRENAWSDPVQISGVNFASPGAAVSMAHQVSMNQLDALLAGKDGAVYVAWVTGGKAWSGPTRISAPNFTPSGGHIALGYQMNMNQLDAMMVGSDGAVYVMWVSGFGKWNGPARLTAPNFATPGGTIAMAHQTSLNQSNAMFVGSDGAVYVMWVTGFGAWQGPTRLTAPHFAAPGGGIAMAHQTNMNQLDAVVVASDGSVNVMWVQGEGRWQGPARISTQGWATSGADVSMAHQTNMSQLDVFVTNTQSELSVMWVQGEGAWQGPAALTEPVVGSSALSHIHQSDSLPPRSHEKRVRRHS